jgi:hypothetical protein
VLSAAIGALEDPGRDRLRTRSVLISSIHEPTPGTYARTNRETNGDVMTDERQHPARPEQPGEGGFEEGQQTLPNHYHVGQFSDGNVTLPDDDRVGKFSDGAATRLEDEREGKFSDSVGPDS